MDIPAIRENVTAVTGLILFIISAILQIILHFTNAKNLAFQAIGSPIKKTRLWNPLDDTEFYT